MKKWITLMVLIIIGVIAYNYVFQSHRDIQAEEAAFVLTATEISNEFSINPLQSEKKYLNKTIQVSGSVSNKNNNSITLNDNVFCQFSNTIKDDLNESAPVKIKGRFIGYDDLLEEIKLDQCNIIN